MADDELDIEGVGKQIAVLLSNDFLEAGRFLNIVQLERRELFREVADSAGIKRRRAYYLAEIDRRFGESGISKARLRSIGWTKLKVLCARIENQEWDGLSAEDREKYLAFAETHTVVELDRFTLGMPATSGTQTVVLHFSQQQYEIFEAAILACGATRRGKGLLNKEAALIGALTIADPGQEMDQALSQMAG